MRPPCPSAKVHNLFSFLDIIPLKNAAFAFFKDETVEYLSLRLWLA